ncbi:eukaryotic translation initiation factor 2-alpha kinase 3-like [Haliotis rufescens]|uniref:eukaryotic translation initiation factor 2-alpha kinase 3-like n=1 Tax=Haliotis rufescens TaxID=6454 RepID=UPI00201E7D30|nr:eukaryotic translation initiation factor 2-alpha kinase 3-like [Haliotis rufescens]
MGRRRVRRWFSRIVGVIASLTALCIARSNVEATDDRPKSCPNPGQESARDKYLMVVSTLDGRVSALDVGDKGQLMWSVQADSRPLLSSSISKMEVMREGVRTRLIPSLDGGLYQYDGDSIEAVPMTAETLLSSSFRLSDNTMMIGGKDIRTYGIDPTTGQIRYLCTMAGCHDLSQGESRADDDLIVITRNTQTVRAVDARIGAEKWNFSVGRHEIEIIDGQKPSRPEEIDDDDDDGVTIAACNPGEGLSPEEMSDLEGNLKIIVPEGMIVALNPEDSVSVMWQHKFSSPVANAWLMHQGQLKQMSLFDTRHVPAISSFQPDDIDSPPGDPLLYVGMHQNQLYVQPSDQMQETVSAAAANSLQTVPLRITWRPYLSTATSRTPIMNPSQDLPQIAEGVDDAQAATSLVSWHENYPFDNGYYLFPDFSPTTLAIEEGPNGSRRDGAGNVMGMNLPLWTWWKEMVAITLMTVVVHLLLSRYTHRDQPDNTSRQVSTDSTSSKGSETSQILPEPQKQAEYSSRFSQDFDCLHCLGKGGFGIVFEAKNKVDDCKYAVKRICIPNREGQKERVIREVKALAKLDHVGIVRFYHAWLETPPSGWQEERDKQFEDSECLTPMPCNTGTDLSSISRFPPNQAMEPSLSDFNPFINKLGILPEENSSSLSRLNHLREGTSQEFSAHSNMDCSTDESGSFSYIGGEPDKRCAEDEDSFSIEFMNSQSGGKESKSSGIPFQSYLHSSSESIQPSHQGDADSFSIVFEDSGCKDKSSNDVSHERDNSGETDSNVVFKDHSIRIEKSENSGLPSQNSDRHTSETPEDSHSVGKKLATPKVYVYIQMQLCRRETLKEWMCANTLNRDRTAILDIFDQIVSAVEYVHECGLMHRDLKPSNIFFSVDGTIKIGDFGLVTELVEAHDIVGEAGDAYAKHTAEVGTQLYMSPEQIARRQYDHKVDIFSLGMILFELLYPFSTQMERIRTLVDIKKQIFPDRFIREMPKEHDVVKWLVSQKPSERPSACAILEHDLLKDFAPRRQASRFRTRTISSGSNNSTGS